MRGSLAAFVLLTLAGCVDIQANPSEAEHFFGGAFTKAATQDDIAEFGRRMRTHGGDAAIMESFPAQFRVDRFGITACQAALAEAKTLDYVASTTPCRAVVGSSDAGSPTSTSVSTRES